MSANEHTPGSWEVEHHPGHPGRGEPEYYSIEAPILSRTGTIADTLNCDHLFTAEEQRDHAHIIAAAPDLLAALRSVPTLGVYESDRDYAIRMAAWLGTRNAAIARALTPTDFHPPRVE